MSSLFGYGCSAVWRSPPAFRRRRHKLLRPENLQRQQQTQQQVRATARELVGSVIDVQLQQLKENGLTANPLYADIRAMRLWPRCAWWTPRCPRWSGCWKKWNRPNLRIAKQIYLEARNKSREVVVRLLVERQNLMRLEGGGNGRAG